MQDRRDYFQGRGAQVNSVNPFDKATVVREHIEGLDEELLENTATRFFLEHPRKLINKVDSPDLNLMFSMNPYQGCEHGCIYCYARNAHHYWGLSAGLDFERKIIVKKNAPELLEKELLNPHWRPAPIMLSGNTDCYQPGERKFRITRSLLEIMLRFRNPVSIITKNSLILRDVDIISEMARLNLVHVAVSITTLNESLRRNLEPRTVTGKGRLKVIEKLSEAGVPCCVMNAPIIPGLNSSEIPVILKEAADHGAVSAGITIVRLNGAISELFTDWITRNYPDRASKVLNMIAACHGGKLNDSQYGRRMQGDGNVAQSINTLFKISRDKHFAGRSMPAYDLSSFRRIRNGQTALF